MRMLAFLVFMICTATLVYESNTLQAVQPSKQTVSIQAAAAQCLSYRSAVMAFMTANPTFTGTIQSAQLTAYSPQFSTVFLSNYAATNAVTVSGTGRMITVYAALPTGSLQQVLVQSGNDASIGLSAGSTWTTDANGVTMSPQPLNVTVPVGDVVSVVKTGN